MRITGNVNEDNDEYDDNDGVRHVDCNEENDDDVTAADDEGAVDDIN